MNALTKLQQVKFMSSREISELTGKRHDNVVRDTRQMLGSLDDSILSHEEYQELKDNRGYTSEFLLNKNLSITLMTGYDVNARHKINVRWQELEAQINKPIDPMQLLANPNLLRNALLTYSEKVIELEQKVEVMQPTIDAFDRIATADGSLCLTDAAKTLQQEPHKFNKWLNLNDWIYKRTGSKHWVAYQEKIKSGYLEHKVKDIPMPDGSIKISEQVRVTPKGLTKLSKLLGNNNV
ncbi:phage antirepressor KilAC domain-containing protein [Acinetobacter populi]|uniref:DNA-binding protein n=1 Tax=Acinetobacter populi TaxID=1582270 RepID=A0A1Z9YXP9_9GAMM|nr:phage antirepressor KilAC domain-containing protein [Acinetobacter populi]OUY06985.1 DNA-binding protein [Acinetobacter populi]